MAARARHHGALTGATTALQRRRQRAASRLSRQPTTRHWRISGGRTGERDNIDLTLISSTTSRSICMYSCAPHILVHHTLQTPRGNCAQAASNTSTSRPRPLNPAPPQHRDTRRRCLATAGAFTLGRPRAPQCLPFRVYAHNDTWTPTSFRRFDRPQAETRPRIRGHAVSWYPEPTRQTPRAPPAFAAPLSRPSPRGG